jgi:heme oxygenase (mycobilin-producing)
MIKRFVKLTFQEDKIDDFLLIFEKSKQKIRAREGCCHVELLQMPSQPNVMFTLSLWDSEADLNAYRQSELFVTTWAATKALFSEKPEAWTTNMISAAEDL